ncbi:MAG: GNAT family N-acetyltransferase [Planctomycetes bacterium]|nr:GNAT family N-acetyltransferase [Planctomycetota bacterium]
MDYLFAPFRFETPEFILRCYRPGDGALLREAGNASYDHLKPFMPWAKPDQSDEEAERLVREFNARWLLARDFVIALMSPDERELWGGGGYHLREGGLELRSAEMGMWIRGDRAGRGLGTRFLGAMLRWGFSEWPWLRLSWRCDAANPASVRVAEKAGLEREGRLKSHMLAPSGERRDTICFAILRESFVR